MTAKQRLPIDFGNGVVYSLEAARLDGASPRAKNVFTYRGSLQRLPGLTSSSLASVGEPILAMVDYYVDEVFQYVVLVTLTKVKKLVLGVFTNLGDYTANAGSHVTIFRHLNTLIIVGVGKEPLQWDGTNLTILTGLTGVYAYCGTDYSTYTLLGDVTEGGIRSRTRLKWSDVADPNEWTTGTAGFMDVLETPGSITRIAPLMDKLIVYKEDSIWEAVYVGSPKYFQLYMLSGNIGCLSPGTVCEGKSMHIFFSGENVYTIQGRAITPIGDQIKTILAGAEATIARSAVMIAAAVFLEDYNEYWLALTTSSTVSNDLVLVYQFDTQSWWVKDVTNLVSLGKTKNSNLRTWADMVGAWDANTDTWNASDITGALRLLIGTTADVEYVDREVLTTDESYASAYWESKDLTAEWNSRWTMLTSEVKGTVGLTAYYSTDEGVTWTTLGSQAGGSTNYTQARWTFNITAETVRFKLIWGEGDVRVKGITAYHTVRKGYR